MSIKVIFAIFSSVSLGAAGIGGAFLYEHLTKSDVRGEEKISEQDFGGELVDKTFSEVSDGGLSASSNTHGNGGEEELKRTG